MKRIPLLAVVAVLGGCGGGGAKPVDDAAELAPPTTPTFVVLKTDPGLQARVLGRFPFGPSTLREIRQGLRMKRVLGPELELAIFRSGTVFFTQPPDEKRFEAALAVNQVHARIRGWTAYTNKPALLDLVRHQHGALATRSAYVAATRSLPTDALVRAYTVRGARAVPGVPALLLPRLPARPKWFGVAVGSSGDKVTIEQRTPGAGAGSGARATSELASRIPAGAVLALGLDTLRRLRGKLTIAGVDLRRVVAAVGENAVAYVRPALPFPEVTIASRPDDPPAALRNVARLVATLGRPRFPSVPITVDGFGLQDVALGAVDIYYGRDDDTVVVSDATDAVAALRSGGAKLNVAGLPDGADRLLYADAEHGIPALQAFAKLANQRVPAEVEAKLRPLKTIVVYRTQEGRAQTFVTVLQSR
ncbi:MAG: hypothetical protein ACJ77E_16675 [Gaiellaceae bacterium]